MVLLIGNSSSISSLYEAFSYHHHRALVEELVEDVREARARSSYYSIHHHQNNNNNSGDPGEASNCIPPAALVLLPLIVRHPELLETAARLHIHLCGQHQTVTRRLANNLDALMAKQEEEVNRVLQLTDIPLSHHQPRWSSGSRGVNDDDNDGHLIISGRSTLHLVEKHRQELDTCTRESLLQSAESELEVRNNFASFLQVASEDLEEILTGSRRQSMSLFAPSAGTDDYISSSPVSTATTHPKGGASGGYDKHSESSVESLEAMLMDNFFLPTMFRTQSPRSARREPVTAVLSLKFPNILRVKYGSSARSRDPSLAPIVCNVSDVHSGFLDTVLSLSRGPPPPPVRHPKRSVARSRSALSISGDANEEEEGIDDDDEEEEINSNAGSHKLRHVDVVKAHFTRQAVGRQSVAVIIASTNEEVHHFCRVHLGINCSPATTQEGWNGGCGDHGKKEDERCKYHRKTETNDSKFSDDHDQSRESATEVTLETTRGEGELPTDVPVDLLLNDTLRRKCYQVLRLPTTSRMDESRAVNDPSDDDDHGKDSDGHGVTDNRTSSSESRYVDANVYLSGGLFGASLIVPLALENFQRGEIPTVRPSSSPTVPVSAIETILEASVEWNADIINFVVLRSCERSSYGYSSATMAASNNDFPPYYHFFKNYNHAVANIQMKNNGSARVIHGTGLSKGLFSVNGRGFLAASSSSPRVSTTTGSGSSGWGYSSSSSSSPRTCRGNWSWNVQDTHINVFLDVSRVDHIHDETLEGLCRRAVEPFDGVEVAVV